MNVMRFVGKTSREAMRNLRDALGPDALVLANRPCAEGVELLAAAPSALGALPPTTPRAASPAARAAARAAVEAPAGGADEPGDARGLPPSMSTVSFQDYVRQRLRERNRTGSDTRPAAPAARSAAAPAVAPAAARAVAPTVSAPPAPSVADTRRAAPRPVDAPAVAQAAGDARPIDARPVGRRPADARAPDARVASGPSGPTFDAAAAIEPSPPAAHWSPALPAAALATAPAAGHDALVAELQSLKGMISRQFATISWFEGVRRSPVQGKLLRDMVSAGFSLKLARSVVSRLPSDFGERDAQNWLEEVLARNLRCAPPAESFEAGGVYALVGPTGVGKTTTTAKLAARHVLKHGSQSVALITVDTYRLGAHDQLRAFGRILGVPVHIAHDASALHDLLRLRGSRQLVLVDTVGMGHRDERIGSLLMSLPRTDIRHVVVASCAAQAETIDESLRAYEARQAAGVILTKVDEAARLGGALDCLLRQRLRLLGVCDGQRVPEDWQSPDPARLVRRALIAPAGGAFALDDEELPLVFGVAAARQGGVAHA